LTVTVFDSFGKPSALDECPWVAHYPLRTVLPGTHQIAKRLVDVIGATVGLILLGPLIALAALGVKLTGPKGPVFFVQSRTGLGGRQFSLYKLRTMVPDAEKRKRELAHLNTRQWPDFKITRDPRVTRVGRLLRATSIDELPQLFNVLRGDMSLVGPRPTSLPAGKFAQWHHERFEVRPGLTGLWQVTARDASSFDHRLRLDIAYTSRQSFRLDLAILAKTVPAVFHARGAV
jgi:lipopolysaccharide/colanic/teichoic acid biosynthesis glycosyltransferase